MNIINMIKNLVWYVYKVKYYSENLHKKSDSGGIMFWADGVETQLLIKGCLFESEERSWHQTRNVPVIKEQTYKKTTDPGRQVWNRPGPTISGSRIPVRYTNVPESSIVPDKWKINFLF